MRRVLTIGHSTRPLDAFVALLVGHGVRTVVDVRTMPHSRRNPQFDRDALPPALAAVGIAYVHMPELGGLRHPQPDSPNSGWKNEGFRGYADHMSTEGFGEGIRRLMGIGDGAVLMCAEAVPWRCHRSLLADALVVRGVAVGHITGEGKILDHTLTAWARVEGETIMYPPQQGSLPFG